MGDGGAYLMGFMLAWTAVMLHVRNEQVSVWAPFVVCAYPIIETLFSILRRYWKSLSPGSADSEHLHSLIKIKIVRRYFNRLPHYMKNSIVSPFCWTITLACALPAIVFYQDTQKLVLIFFGGCVLYGAIYRLLVNLEDTTVVTPKKLIRRDA
jgi:UDP-N-acetylmuramyl pentapeptide phosphotransferase/UDP-N-acetylglucosamine-1-phosphate transferase